MFDFGNQIVIVTGAAGNLGGALARAFQAAGARLVLVDHKPDRLPDLFPNLAGSSDHFLATSVDLTDEKAVEGMVRETLERFGRIDVLVNTAGGYRGGTPAYEMSLEEWDLMLDMNARTVLIASRAVIPAMLEQGAGKIINIGSRAALEGGAKSAGYSASKSAVLRLTESMDAALKKSGINVNCVVPGTIDTPQNRESMPKADTSRWVAPEALADVILFLASDAARAVHGVAIPVYGLG
jgi:NAD(P)-dependent dehydrogenase (short-subunit alcohol dehydrogenase family)